MSESDQKKVSSVERLRALAEVFTLEIAAESIGTNTTTASVYIHRWRRLGLIKPLGDRAGVYFNLLKDINGPETRIGEGLRLIYREAVLRAEAVLIGAGWLDPGDSARMVTVAVDARRSYLSGENLAIEGRSPGWFKTMAPFITNQPHWPAYGIPSLTPAAAVADLCFKGTPPPVSSLKVAAADWHSIGLACRSLGVELPEDYKAAIKDNGVSSMPTKRGIGGLSGPG